MYERYRIERHNTISELYYIRDVYFGHIIVGGLTREQADNWEPPSTK